LNLRRESVQADLLRDRSKSGAVRFESLAQTDLILYLYFKRKQAGLLVVSTDDGFSWHESFGVAGLRPRELEEILQQVARAFPLSISYC
jgi:hypothetical protein